MGCLIFILDVPVQGPVIIWAVNMRFCMSFHLKDDKFRKANFHLHYPDGEIRMQVIGLRFFCFVINPKFNLHLYPCTWQTSKLLACFP